MKGIKLDHCVIHVSNWERSNKFYAEVMGAQIIPVGNGFSYRFGETQLNCHGPNVTVEQIAKIKVMPGGSDLCFIWPDTLKSLTEHLDKHSLKIEAGPVKRFGAKGYGRSFYFRDPDGSLLEYIHYSDGSFQK